VSSDREPGLLFSSSARFLRTASISSSASCSLLRFVNGSNSRFAILFLRDRAGARLICLAQSKHVPCSISKLLV
jgi:hypothetical protein